MCSKFRIKIMSNKKVTAYQTAIPLDFKVAINSLIAEMSWDRGGLSSTKNYICNLKIASEAGSMSWSIVMLVFKVCSLLILTQRIMPQDEEHCQCSVWTMCCKSWLTRPMSIFKRLSSLVTISEDLYS